MPLVRVLKVGGQALVQPTVGYPAEIRPRHESPLSFRVPGKIVERRVVPGSRVKAGDILARLDATDLKLAVNSAESVSASAKAELELAQVELRRFKDLRDKNYISAAEYERRAATFVTAQARHEAAESQRRQAVNQEGYANLVADSDGVILGVDAEVDQVVAAGQRVMRMARPEEKEAVIAVPEAQHHAISRARNFTVTVSALPGKSWQGRLRELSPSADPVTRTYAARISIPEAGPEVELGMSARVSIRAQADTGVELPVNAIRSRGEGESVWVVDGAGKVHAVPVKLRSMGAEAVVVASDLKEGDQVVVAGTHLLRAGQRVRILQEDAKR